MVVTLLVFAVWIPNPSSFSQWIFIVVLALAAAGVGAVIPGMLHVDLPFAKAGGALAIFAIIFWQKPAIVDAVARIKPPSHPPTALIREFLAATDRQDMQKVWEMIDPEAKGVIVRDFEQLQTVYAAGRDPLGKVLARREIGSSGAQSPPGYPIGVYSVTQFRTRFASGQCHLEAVSVRATDSLEWRIFDHNVSPQPVPCLPGD